MNRILTIIISLFCVASCLAKDFLVKAGSVVKVYMPRVDRPVAYTALDMFGGDMENVLSCHLVPAKIKKQADIVVMLRNNLPREGFSIDVKKGQLYVFGADAHGIAYGLLEVSRMIGVSPWEYWADCSPRKLDCFTLSDGYHDEQYPAVEYRGIFINDEDWGLSPWATRQEPEAWTIREGRIKGAIGPKVNEKIFQLMLRLRANYYWPAMHECSQPFFTIKGNREVAEKYGIYVGGSHCEPMATSPAAEWSLSGQGDYNYVTNSDNVRSFWQKRLNEVKGQEIVYTIGMRGVHDGSMQGVKTKEDKLKYLQQVIDDQREMLKAVNTDVTKVPQVFVPYKEVLEIYKSGLHVPDDVTLMWTDDNYGYIRHFPDSVERGRTGGNGVYYHVSYWGRPHDYLWLNSLSPDLLQNQMLEAYSRGIRKMWILNVGDIKPSEYQIEQFMQLAWTGKIVNCMDAFVQREFGKEYVSELRDILLRYFDLSAEMKPEHMAGTRVEEADKAYWNKIHPISDWTKAKVQQRVRSYQDLSDRVEKLWKTIPDDRRDAFFQLVKYPVQAATQMNFKFLCPDHCVEAYDSIQSLTYTYNKICAGGKWNGIMDASPRNLPVFSRVTPDMLPSYPDSSMWRVIDSHGDGHNFLFTTEAGTDSVSLRIELVPNHPFEGERLAFAVEVDGYRSEDIEYQTYDRSEEWKQNVIRGYAVRVVNVPLDPTKTQHKIRVLPATPGVELKRILVSCRNSQN